MVMELVSGSRMVKADRECLNLIDDGIDVAASESIENVTTCEGDTGGSRVVVS